MMKISVNFLYAPKKSVFLAVNSSIHIKSITCFMATWLLSSFLLQQTLMSKFRYSGECIPLCAHKRFHWKDSFCRFRAYYLSPFKYHVSLKELFKLFSKMAHHNLCTCEIFTRSENLQWRLLILFLTGNSMFFKQF